MKMNMNVFRSTWSIYAGGIIIIIGITYLYLVFPSILSWTLMDSTLNSRHNSKDIKMSSEEKELFSEGAILDMG